MRSLLFNPGDSPRKLAKGMVSGADVLLIDLEDSVAADAKAEARRIAAGFLAENIPASDRPRLFVRINAFDTGLAEADLAAVMPHAPDGIMLPKAEGGTDVARLHAMLSVEEAQAGLADGQTEILVVATETASAVFNLGTYGNASPRLKGITWGAEDLSADIGAAATREADGRFTSPFTFARNLCLFGAVAAGVTPIDTVYTNFRDLDGLKAECEEAVRDGFLGKMAIHPAQVDVINEAFTPSDEAIARAQAIVEAFAAAGDAGVIGVDGEMLDRPHQRRSEKILERARLAGKIA